MSHTILRLGHLGDGVAQGQDGPIYAMQVLPGEVVDGDLAGDRLTNIRIVTPSVHRVRRSPARSPSTTSPGKTCIA